MTTTPPTYRTHRDVLAEILPLRGRRVIDVGSGSGELVRWLRDQGADVVGVECGEVMRRLALDADPEHPDAYLDGVGQDLPLPDGSADAVIYSYSLHHVPSAALDAALREAHRVLRPGGTLIVVEPVAAGAGYEVVKIVDDEAAVRAAAQAALDRAGDAGFEPVNEHRYDSRLVVSSADALATRVVGVDPTRTERMARHRDDFVARFEALATKVDGGYAFDQENIVRVFVNPVTGA
jgi:SAM-dependent methyltransferase